MTTVVTPEGIAPPGAEAKVPAGAWQLAGKIVEPTAGAEPNRQ